MDLKNNLALPPEIMEKIKFYCQDKQLGLAEMSDNNFCIVLMGKIDLSPDEIALMVASVLINGIIDGAWKQSNQLAMQKEKSSHTLN